MTRYYTRACNFYYGNISENLVKKKKSLPLCGNNKISFDQVELITRKSKKKITTNKLSNLPKLLRKQITIDLKNITSKKKKFCKLKFFKITKCHGNFKHYTR